MAAPEVFAALANPTRRRILELLLDEPSTVNAIVEEFRLQRPAVSEHLQVLRNAKLVRHEQQGRERIYSADPTRLVEVYEWLKPFARYWRKGLAALNDVLNEAQP
jgi:DNA-binding transcriptional ArsR family regulator